MVIKALSAVTATIMIGIGCLIYSNYPGPVGAFFFSCGLLGVFFFSLDLYTGQVGYIKSKKELLNTLFVLLFNILGSFVFLLIPQINYNFNAKLANPWYLTLFKGFLCGILIYLCADRYRAGQAWVTLIGVPAFILSGAEHSIADMIYLVLTRSFTIDAFIFILLVAFSNGLGSLSIAALQKLKLKK